MLGSFVKFNPGVAVFRAHSCYLRPASFSLWQGSGMQFQDGGAMRAHPARGACQQQTYPFNKSGTRTTIDGVLIICGS